MRVTAVIPARYASTRFPGKPLALLAGKPMIEHVYRRAQAARLIEYVLVATDDERIRSAVEAFGGQAMMTRPDHPTGTDRIAEVARFLDCEVVVNVQGDEPLISPASLDAVVTPLLADPSLVMSTVMAPLPEEERDDPAAVKVVVDQDGFALYFSRSLIPYPRVPEAAQYHKHLGLYAYRREFLLSFASWPPTMLERTESLEQLRVLERGHRIKVMPVAESSLGVDTPADLERAERLLKAL